MRLGLVLVAALVVTAAIPVATAQDDAWSGGDAPNAPEGVAIGEGTYFGTLDPVEADHDDFYVLDVPSGVGAVILMTPNPAADYDLVALNETYDLVAGSFNWPGETERVYLAGPLRAHVNVMRWEGSGEYELSVALVRRPDIAVTSLEVVPIESGRTPAFDVVITAANIGSVHARADETYVGASAWTTFGARGIGHVTLALAPGESTTQTFRWEATGQVGRVTVEAFGVNYHEENWDNDFRSTEIDLVAPGVFGLGADALNQRAVIPVVVGAAGVGWINDGYMSGAYVYASTGPTTASVASFEPRGGARQTWACATVPGTWGCVVLP